MKNFLSVTIALILVLLISSSFSAHALGNFNAKKSLPNSLVNKHFNQDNIANNNSNKGNSPAVRSSQQAAQMVKSRYGGKVLKVSKRGNSYSVKLLKEDGHVIYVSVDAMTGRMG